MPREKNPEAVSSRKRTPGKSREVPVVASPPPNFVDPDQRATLIARAAYFRAQDRGFVPGSEVAD